MAKQRALIGRKLLLELADNYARGVPITTLKKRYKINLHFTTFTRLLMVCKSASAGNALAEASLFPAWLPDAEHVIYAPTEYEYYGVWPNGFWFSRSLSQQDLLRLK